MLVGGVLSVVCLFVSLSHKSLYYHMCASASKSTYSLEAGVRHSLGWCWGFTSSQGQGLRYLAGAGRWALWRRVIAQFMVKAVLASAQGWPKWLTGLTGDRWLTRAAAHAQEQPPLSRLLFTSTSVTEVQCKAYQSSCRQRSTLPPDYPIFFHEWSSQVDAELIPTLLIFNSRRSDLKVPARWNVLSP